MEAILALAASAGAASWLFNDLFLTGPPSPLAYDLNASSVASLVAIFLAGSLLSTKLTTGRWAPRKMKESDWTKQVVVITGGSGGVGRALCEQLCLKGARVVSLDLSPAVFRHPNFTPWRCDIAYPEEIQAAAAYVLSKFPDYNLVLVNCAGLRSADPKLIVESAPEKVLRSHAVNALSSYWTLKSFLPHMLLQNEGHVVFVASIMAHVGVPRMADYAAGKASVVSLYETLLREIYLERKHTSKSPTASPHGVQASLILPAHIQTPMFEHWQYPFPFNFLTPSLKPDYVASRIISQIASRRSSRIYLPRLTEITRYMDVSPIWFKELMQRLCGADYAIEGMTRRKLELLQERQVAEGEAAQVEGQLPTNGVVVGRQRVEGDASTSDMSIPQATHSNGIASSRSPRSRSPTADSTSSYGGGSGSSSMPPVSPLKIRKRTSTSQPSLGAVTSPSPSPPSPSEQEEVQEGESPTGSIEGVPPTTATAATTRGRRKKKAAPKSVTST